MLEGLRVLNAAFKFARARDFESAAEMLKKINKNELSATSQNAYDRLLSLIEKNGSKVFQSDSIVGKSRKKQARVKLVYCILAMQHELDVLKITVSPLIQQLNPGDAIYILFNGFNDHPLKTHFEKHSGIKVFQSNSNLGVAGGRNHLYSTILLDDEFDYVITLDNDVIVPNDFNEVIKSEVNAHYTNDTGVLGSVILDYKKQNVRAFLEKNFLSFPGYLSAINYNIFSYDIKSFIRNSEAALDTLLWHIGIDKDYQAAYIDREDLFELSSGREQTFYPFLARSPLTTKLIQKEVFEVSNVPGCFQLVSTKVLKSAGLLEESFSPYFFEDSEFCIRLQRMGLHNKISTNIVLFHGTDSRHLERTKVSSKFDFITNEYRARLILLNKLSVERSVKKLVNQSLRRYLIEENPRKAISDFVASLVGLRKGMMQSGLTTANKGADCDFSPRILTEKSNQSFKNITFDESLPSPDKQLPQTYFTNLKKFKNAYSGQDCLIVCNGPSLKRTRLGLFKNMPTFCVNSTFILQDQLGFKPHFYTVEDNHVIEDNIEKIKKMASGAKFFPEKYRAKLGDEKDLFYLPTVWDCYWKSKVAYENPEFSTDVTRSVYAGQTVTYLNLQLAYFMGFKRVFIVGLDFSYSIPKGSKVDNNSIDHDDDDPNHFHPNYFGKGRQWHFPKLDSCMVSYSTADQEFARANREVIDLTLSGRLNVFRKSTLEQELGLDDAPEQIGAGLDFRQYVIDSVYSDSKLVESIDFQSSVDIKFSTSLEKHSRIWNYSEQSNFIYNMTVAIKASHDSTIIVYPEAKSIVSHNCLCTASLPLCSWFDSTISTKVGEVNLRETADEVLMLSEKMSFFIPNSGAGCDNLVAFVKKHSELRMVIVADQLRILIKVIGANSG